MTTLGEDPAVLTWRIAMAPRPRFTTNGRHWWRDLVTAAWHAADHAWWLDREAVALGYRTEMAEYAAPGRLHAAPVERCARPRTCSDVNHL